MNRDCLIQEQKRTSGIKQKEESTREKAKGQGYWKQTFPQSKSINRLPFLLGKYFSIPPAKYNKNTRHYFLNKHKKTLKVWRTEGRLVRDLGTWGMTYMVASSWDFLFDISQTWSWRNRQSRNVNRHRPKRILNSLYSLDRWPENGQPRKTENL